MPKKALADITLVGLLVDGIGVGEYTIVVAMGVTPAWKKPPLGLHQCSTENTTGVAAPRLQAQPAEITDGPIERLHLES